jgi:hypothetical protein
MKRTLAITLSGFLALGGCARTAQVAAGGDVASATPTSRDYLPTGTTFSAHINQTLGTTTSHDGDQFTATVSEPVMTQDGATAVPAGATINGHVTGLHNATIPGDQSIIRLDFDNLVVNGRSYPFEGSISHVSVQNQSTGSNTSSATRGAVTGAAAGAVLGAIVSGGELSKILTGGLLGAAAGTVISLGTGGSESTIPSGSAITVRATQPVQLRQ